MRSSSLIQDWHISANFIQLSYDNALEHHERFLDAFLL